MMLQISNHKRCSTVCQRYFRSKKWHHATLISAEETIVLCCFMLKKLHFYLILTVLKCDYTSWHHNHNIVSLDPGGIESRIFRPQIPALPSKLPCCSFLLDLFLWIILTHQFSSLFWINLTKPVLNWWNKINCWAWNDSPYGICYSKYNQSNYIVILFTRSNIVKILNIYTMLSCTHL